VTGLDAGLRDAVVTLTHGFWLGKYELTQAQYNAVMRQDTFPATDVPAQRVSWNDAMEFCQRLTVMMRKAGETSRGLRFHAADRGAMGIRVPGGDSRRVCRRC
jgi:hypothetical protein